MYLSAVFIQNAFYVCPRNTSWANLETSKGGVPVSRLLVSEPDMYPSKLIRLALPRWAFACRFFSL